MRGNRRCSRGSAAVHCLVSLNRWNAPSRTPRHFLGLDAAVATFFRLTPTSPPALSATAEGKGSWACGPGKGKVRIKMMAGLAPAWGPGGAQPWLGVQRQRWGQSDAVTRWPRGDTRSRLLSRHPRANIGVSGRPIAGVPYLQPLGATVGRPPRGPARRGLAQAAAAQRCDNAHIRATPECGLHCAEDGYASSGSEGARWRTPPGRGIVFDSQCRRGVAGRQRALIVDGGPNKDPHKTAAVKVKPATGGSSTHITAGMHREQCEQCVRQATRRDATRRNGTAPVYTAMRPVPSNTHCSHASLG